MNLANKITISRLFLVIVMLVIVLVCHACGAYEALSGYGWAKMVAGGIFVVAAYTDHLDGHIARSRNMVTTFGKFLDPIADKLLVNSTFILFCAGIFPDIRISALIVVIMVGRDIIVDAIRMIAVEKQQVIAASIWGKLKTVMQIIGLTACFFLPTSVNWLAGQWYSVASWLIYAAAACSLLSGADYFWKSRKIVLEGIR